VAPISSGANGLVLGQLTGTPGMSVSEAGSGHGSTRRDQLTAAAIAGTAMITRRVASSSERNPTIARIRYSVLLKTAW
jgi:hypothetical protein